MRRSSERLERLEHQSNRPLGVLHTVPVSMYEKAIAKGWWTRVKSKTRGGYGLPNTLLSNIIKVPNYCFTQPFASLSLNSIIQRSRTEPQDCNLKRKTAVANIDTTICKAQAMVQHTLTDRPNNARR